MVAHLCSELPCCETICREICACARRWRRREAPQNSPQSPGLQHRQISNPDFKKQFKFQTRNSHSKILEDFLFEKNSYVNSIKLVTGHTSRGSSHWQTIAHVLHYPPPTSAHTFVIGPVVIKNNNMQVCSE